MLIKTYTKGTKQDGEFRALVISDIHFSKEKDVKILDSIANRIEREIFEKGRFDAIFVVGDIIDATNILHNEHAKYVGELFTFFSKLGLYAPTYVVCGNHDLGYFSKSKQGHWVKDEQTFQYKFLDQINKIHGIHVLENETTRILDGYTVSGINPSLDYVLDKPDGDRELLFEMKDRLSFLKRLKAEDENILLCHYPQALLALKDEEELEHIDLSIAGHNHNGATQFIPLEIFLNLIGQKNRGLISPGNTLFPNNIRGIIRLSERNTMLINPAVKTFSSCAGVLENVDCLFYKGASEIQFCPGDDFSLSRKR